MQRPTVCLIAVAVLTGCGGGGPKSDPEAVHDLLKGAAKAVADRNQIKDAEPQSVSVIGTTATADVVVPSATNQGQSLRLTLQKVGDDWKISSLTL